jgi:putative N-acetylmannosamine-6-phosphate epimerase
MEIKIQMVLVSTVPVVILGGLDSAEVTNTTLTTINKLGTTLIGLEKQGKDSMVEDFQIVREVEDENYSLLCDIPYSV